MTVKLVQPFPSLCPKNYVSHCKTVVNDAYLVGLDSNFCSGNTTAGQLFPVSVSLAFNISLVLIMLHEANQVSAGTIL